MTRARQKSLTGKIFDNILFLAEVWRSGGPRYPEDAGVGDGEVLRPASPES